MSLSSIAKKYEDSLAKDTTYKSSKKPNLKPIGNMKTFWETSKDEVLEHT